VVGISKDPRQWAPRLPGLHARLIHRSYAGVPTKIGRVLSGRSHGWFGSESVPSVRIGAREARLSPAPSLVLVYLVYSRRAVAFSAGGDGGRRLPEHSRAIRTLLFAGVLGDTEGVRTH
jgi:hypothetical protein